MSPRIREYERLWKKALGKKDIDERIPYMNEMDLLWAAMDAEEQREALAIGAGLLRSSSGFGE